MGVSARPPHEVKEVRPRVAIIVTSDSKFLSLLRGEVVSDESGAICFNLLSRQGADVFNQLIVPNNKDLIASLVKHLVDVLDVNTIVITGGTGLSTKDITIEAVESVAEKELHGFGELFRRLSYESIGEHAILSRASAYTYKRCVIFCLPGSPDAVRLALERIIIPVLRHVLHELNK